MSALPWILVLLLLCGTLLAQLTAPRSRERRLAARERELARHCQALGVSLPKLPLSKSGEKVYHREE